MGLRRVALLEAKVTASEGGSRRRLMYGASVEANMEVWRRDVTCLAHIPQLGETHRPVEQERGDPGPREAS